MKNLVYILLSVLPFGMNAQILEDFTVQQCESLIAERVNDPNFIILDVRTPNEYNPEHLEGAIIRNFYDDDFQEQLDALPKDKTYLMHCRSGSRSATTLVMMGDLGFKEVYNMLGGINGWNAASLPVTALFEAQFMSISDTVFPDKPVHVNETDSILITVTNRGNDVLNFISTTELNDVFSTDLDLSTTLLGAEDYSFYIFHTPFTAVVHELDFTLESNVGSLTYNIIRSAFTTTSAVDVDTPNISIHPNPTSDFVFIEGMEKGQSYTIADINGKIISKGKIAASKIDVSNFQTGIYTLSFHKDGRMFSKKLIIR